MISQPLLSVLLLLGFAVASASHAQDTHEEQAPAGALAANPIEPLAELLAEIELRELELYAHYNTLNSSDAFDVVCNRLPVDSSQPARQDCEPVFIRKIREQVAEEIAQESAEGLGFFARIRGAFVSPEERAERIVRERALGSVRLMQQEMEALASADAQFAAALTAIGQLQVAYLEQVQSNRSRNAYLMRQNDPSSTAFSFDQRRSEPRPTLGAPPPGHTQPSIRFPADVSPRFRP